MFNKMAESCRLVTKGSGNPIQLTVKRATLDDVDNMARLASRACGKPIKATQIMKLDLAEKAVCVTARFEQPDVLMGYSSALPTEPGAYIVRSLVLVEPNDIGTTTELIHGMIRELRRLDGKKLLMKVSKDHYELYAQLGFRSSGNHSPGAEVFISLDL